MFGSLSADIMFRETVFRERSSGKTVSFEEHIMSKNKYPSIFWRHMEATVFIILRNTRAFENWGISPGYSTVLAGE